MSLRKPRQAPAQDDEDWMTTFCDVICLLLCFFVILISVSEPKQSEIEKVRAMFMSAFVETEITSPFTDLMEQVESLIEQNQMETEMSVEETDKGLVLELASSSFYESGSAEFKKSAIPILEELATLLNDFDYEDYLVEAEGHTDDVPIKTRMFPSNWELSAGRATRIVRFFIAKGQEKEKMRAAGFSDVVPKVPNLDEFGNPIPENRELNRRVVLKIERRD